MRLNECYSSDDMSHHFHGQHDMLNKRYDSALFDSCGKCQNISNSGLNNKGKNTLIECNINPKFIFGVKKRLSIFLF